MSIFRRLRRRLPGLRGVAATLDRTRAERNQLQSERDRLRQERDELRRERDELVTRIGTEQPRRASQEHRRQAAETSFERTFKRVQAQLLSTARKQAGLFGDVAPELWSRGFLPDKSRLYAIDRHGPDVYLSDLQREMTRFINGPFKPILRNKAVFNELFRAVVPTVPVLGYTDGRRFWGAIPDRGALFAKPVTGGAGVDVLQATVQNGHVIVADRSLSESAFINELVERNREYIVTPAVETHAKLRELFDRTTNTVRVLMMRCPATSEGFMAAAVLRVGTNTSGGLDNFSRGGISFAVDLGSGAIGMGWEKRGTVSDVHPDTGIRITGRRVPMWDEVVQICRKAFEHCRSMSYVGWDIIVTPNGPVVLEGNYFSDVNLLQVHKPLLSDDRVRGFYDHHGILEWQPSEAL